jgi:prevent-host-death family protein
MKTVTATEIKNRFGSYLELAREEPIAVQRPGRPAVVVLSVKEYERLTWLEDQYWDEILNTGLFLREDPVSDKAKKINRINESAAIPGPNRRFNLGL